MWTQQSRCGTIFTVCSHTFILFWLTKTSKKVETYQLSFFQFISAFIWSHHFLSKSFLFLYIFCEYKTFLTLVILRYTYMYIYIYIYLGKKSNSSLSRKLSLERLQTHSKIPAMNKTLWLHKSSTNQDKITLLLPKSEPMAAQGTSSLFCTHCHFSQCVYVHIFFTYIGASMGLKHFIYNVLDFNLQLTDMNKSFRK